MRKDTVLVHVPCDVRRLPLNAFEGYLLSLVDGRLTLDELAEIAGTTFAQISRHAAHLVDVGAVVVAGDARPSRRSSGQAAAVKRSTRAPSAARATMAPQSRRSRRPSAPADRPAPSLRGAALRSTTAHPSSARGKSVRAMSTRSSTSRPPSPRSVRAAPQESGAPIDDTVRSRIVELDRRLAALDHYALLGVGRDAEKTSVKRAYFALAAEFHPDRYFGKKLGEAKAPLERIFVRLTDAHDTLCNRARRAAYDTSLPPAPVVSQPQPQAPPPSPPPSKRPSARRSTKKMKAVAPRSPTPATRAAPPIAPPKLEARPVARAATPEPPIPSSDEALRRLYWARKQNEAQRRLAVFVDAAEAALARDDVVAAVESYRLALQVRDDAEIRQKVQAIEWRAKARIYETSVARARAAEQTSRWDEAAIQFAQANAAKPEAWTAERAAYAIRMHGGDVRRAVQLAEQAVLAEPQNAGYHVTLGEVCLAAKLFARAAGEATRALTLAPNDERAKALAAAAKKR